MRILTITLIVGLFLPITMMIHASDVAVDLDKDFIRLDSVVAKRHTYIKEKEKEINTTKQILSSAENSADRYSIYKRLYDLYVKFHPDSASVYASLCLEEAKKMGSKDAEKMAQIDIVMISILRSDLYAAYTRLREMDSIKVMPPVLQTKLAIALMEFYVRANMFKTSDIDIPMAQDLALVWETYGKYLPEDSWKREYYRTSLLKEYDVDKLKSLVASSPRPSIQAAMLEYHIATYYKSIGDDDHYCHYIIESAIDDVSCANREVQSLVYIVNSPFVDKKSRRAFEYTMLCTENAEIYKDVGRSRLIVEAHSSITKEFEHELQKRANMFIVIIVALIFMLMLTVFMYYVIISKRRSQQRLLEQISDINKQLSVKIDSEQKIKNELAESYGQLKTEIARRNKNFMNVYLMVGKYISSVQKFNKDIYNLITAGKLEKARSMLNSDEQTAEYLRSFYQQFDLAFLSIHPDFLERFNRLLLPDKQMRLPEPGVLSPELRIYALVSIGITDSVSIAEFLQYSPQTIYNYRLKVRHNACIPEKEFANTVAHLFDDQEQ